MTQTDNSKVLTQPANEPAHRQPTVESGAHWSVRWLRNPLVLGLAAIVIFNLLWALPRYLHFDKKLSRIPLDPAFPAHWHFQVLVAHVLTANLALLLVFFQLSSQLRRRFPVIHRVSGRVYIFGGALPTSLLAIVLIPYGHQPYGQLGLNTMAVLWFFTTVMGYVRVRQHRYVQHRRWMVYSFALALATTDGRLIAWGMQHIHGFTMGFNWLFEVTSWVSWTANLLIAHLWLQYTAKRERELVR